MASRTDEDAVTQGEENEGNRGRGEASGRGQTLEAFA